MKDVKLKICGMRDADNIGEVASLNPHYLGFIFYPKSPRYVTDDFLIPEHVLENISRVGIFVNADPTVVLEKASKYKLHFVQLHGNESVEDVKMLKEAGLNIIKVFSVGSDFDFETTKPYESFVDFFLFDTKGKYYGGNAKAFDWQILKQYNQKVPFFLSGGISVENISGLKPLLDMNVHAIDVNSGVEFSPGKKNVDEIKKLQEKLNLIIGK